MKEEHSRPSMNDEMQQALIESGAAEILSTEYRNRKLKLWFIRAGISAGILYYFWDKEWMSWAKYLLIGFPLISLTSILATPYLLKRKMASVKSKIDEVESLSEEEE